MTTNQTIDGVLREDFTDIASAARCMTATTGTEGWGNAVKCFSMLCTPYAVIRMTDEIERLRALLDKEVSGDSRAPQHQGEAVAWTEADALDFMSVALRHAEHSGLSPSDILDGLRFMAEKGKPAFVRAEQPEPVAVAPSCCGSCPGGCVYGLKA